MTGDGGWAGRSAGEVARPNDSTRYRHKNQYDANAKRTTTDRRTHAYTHTYIPRGTEAAILSPHQSTDAHTGHPDLQRNKTTLMSYTDAGRCSLSLPPSFLLSLLLGGRCLTTHAENLLLPSRPPPPVNQPLQQGGD
jgi:hypothetical protein